MKIKYIHNLEYSYEEAVQLGEHRLCIKPRSHGFQRLIKFDLNISPIVPRPNCVLPAPIKTILFILFTLLLIQPPNL